MFMSMRNFFFVPVMLLFAFLPTSIKAQEFAQDSAVVTKLDTAAQHAKSDSLSSTWSSKWIGKAVDVVVKSSSLKLGSFDAAGSRQPVAIAVKEGLLEFSMYGTVALKAEQAQKLRKGKDWKLHVAYHDKSLLLKKGVNRAFLIDGVTVEMDGKRFPVLGEIWIADKVVSSPLYKAWHDSLTAQKRLHTTVRGYALDRRDGQRIPWLSMGSVSWFSRYLSYDSPSAYHCTEAPEQSACRRYSHDELSELCPAGWRIPSESDIDILYQQWSPLGLPFGGGTQIWEVRDEDTTASQGLMLLTPWSGVGAIEPHFWNYLETYATDSTGHVGVFQFGWSETGWMGIFVVDEADQIHHPLRCVAGGAGKPLPPIVPRAQAPVRDFVAPDLSKIPGVLGEDVSPAVLDSTKAQQPTEPDSSKVLSPATSVSVDSIQPPKQ